MIRKLVVGLLGLLAPMRATAQDDGLEVPRHVHLLVDPIYGIDRAVRSGVERWAEGVGILPGQVVITVIGSWPKAKLQGGALLSVWTVPSHVDEYHITLRQQVEEYGTTISEFAVSVQLADPITHRALKIPNNVTGRVRREIPPEPKPETTMRHLIAILAILTLPTLAMAQCPGSSCQAPTVYAPAPYAESAYAYPVTIRSTPTYSSPAYYPDLGPVLYAGPATYAVPHTYSTSTTFVPQTYGFGTRSRVVGSRWGGFRGR